MSLRTRLTIALLILFVLHYDVIITFAKTAQLPPATHSKHSNKNTVSTEELILKNDASRDQPDDVLLDMFSNDSVEELSAKIDENFLYFEKSVFKRDVDMDSYDDINASGYRNESVFNYTDAVDREAYLEHIRNHIYPKNWTWVLICLHSIVFVIGLVGNTLVCVAVYRNHTMRTVTNYFIVNLAVADFLVIFFCLPPSVVWDVTSTWFFGTAMCKIVLYLQVGMHLLVNFCTVDGL